MHTPHTTIHPPHPFTLLPERHFEEIISVWYTDDNYIVGFLPSEVLIDHSAGLY